MTKQFKQAMPNKFSMRSSTASDYSSLSDSQLLFGSQFCLENVQSAAAPLELGTQPGQQNSQDKDMEILDMKSSIQLLKEGLESLPAQLKDQFLEPRTQPAGTALLAPGNPDCPASSIPPPPPRRVLVPGNLPWRPSGVHVPEDLRHGDPVPGSPPQLSRPDPPAPVPGPADPVPAAASAVPRAPPPVPGPPLLRRAAGGGTAARAPGTERRSRPGALRAGSAGCGGRTVPAVAPHQSRLDSAAQPRRVDSVLTMTAAQLVTWGMLLATGVPAKTQGVLPAGLSLGGDPLHSPAWGQQWPGPSPTWEASGEPSGAGAPRSERWGVKHPVHWSPPLQAGDGTRAALEMETTVTDADTKVWRDGSTVPAVADEPFVAWQGHEAEGQDSSLPHGSAQGTSGSEVSTDRGADSPESPWAGQDLSLSRQSVSKRIGRPSPQPTVSATALDARLAAGIRTADAHTAVERHTAAPGLSQDAQLTSASSQSVPLGTAPVSSSTDAGPAWGPHASPGSAQPVGSWGDTGGPPSPSPALTSSAPRLRHTAPSWGLAEPWTRVLPSHQRSTRRAPLSAATTTPGDAAPRTDPGTTGQRGPQPAAGSVLSTGPAPPPVSSTATPSTPSRGLLPEEDVGSPQQVRGAVGPVSVPNATKTTPQPTAHPTTGTLGTRHPDMPGTQTPASSTATPSATWRRAGITPQPVPRDPSSPQPQSSRAPPASGANTTGLRWAELQQQLGFSWEAHVYGLAAVFLLLALGCLAGLAGTAILRPAHLPHVVGAQGLLLAACLLRATFLLLDPYGARGRLPTPALLLLNTAPFPLLLAAFALLLQRLQRLAQLQLLPSRLRGLPALGILAALPSAVMGAADLLPPRLGLTAALGLQLYSAAWLRGVLGPHGRFSRPGWAAQLWLRIGEVGTAVALLAAAAEPVCRRCRRRSPAGHSCWAKALRYFCAGRKAEAPEYPNNCYDWAGSSTGGTGVERTPANDISKNLIRNPAEQLPLRALKDSNEVWAAGTGMPGLSPKCPNMLAARSCAAFEQGSSPSLGELIFRPPSPIDLRRSIDQALCRRHLLHDGLFSRPRRGSGSSLHGSPAPDKTPSLGRMVRCSSLTELPGPRQPPGTVTVTVTASASSLESSSLKISWNPWRHGLSSPDSLPLDEAPSRAPLLVPAGAPGWEREGPHASPALGKAVDSRSLSSDTIEL
ncbi:PREDICTED: proline-rich transmembrane protein 3 [Pseudopodoces humilis]|uniref:proline-rich transmembrane protein 3 n=1 Tax=Pseudopodoces humilis TaxID=181119 RepID=UPI0006B6B6E3|nr:PREDICTED: proline-rich transmembrane protein 3 [Pseudopodoces humilis]